MGGNSPNSRELGRYFALAQVGLEMVVPIVVGLWLDSAFGWSPWGVSVGAVLGLVGGLAHIVHLLKRFDENSSPRQDAQ